MAVYKRGYERYSGPRTGRWTRLLAMPRFAWRRLFEQRLVVIALIVSLFWPAMCALFIYVSNHSELWAGLGAGALTQLLNINANFFLVFLGWQATSAMIVAALAGPGLIAPDLSNNALPLYFSRPMTRWEYVLSRLIVLVGLLSMFTWVPGLALFFMQSGMAGFDWAWANLYIAVVLVAGCVGWILLVSLVALASSALVKWRVIAGGGVLGFFFISAGVAQMVKAIFRSDASQIFNPALLMITLWRAGFGLPPVAGPSPAAAATALLVLFAVLILVLERKLRAVEVVK